MKKRKWANLYGKKAKDDRRDAKRTDIKGAVSVEYGLVGKEGHIETYSTHRPVEDEIKSAIKSKRKEGYKEIQDLYDNSPYTVSNYPNLLAYLDTYLPKFNTHEKEVPIYVRNYCNRWKAV